MTVDATAVTSAGSTASHYKIEKKINQRLFIEPESSESVVAYYLYLDTERTHVESGDTLLNRVNKSSS